CPRTIALSLIVSFQASLEIGKGYLVRSSRNLAILTVTNALPQQSQGKRFLRCPARLLVALSVYGVIEPPDASLKQTTLVGVALRHAVFNSVSMAWVIGPSDLRSIDRSLSPHDYRAPFCLRFLLNPQVRCNCVSMRRRSLRRNDT